MSDWIEFDGWLANWYRLGYELSVVNLTTDVVWISSNCLIASDIQHCLNRPLSITDREIVQSIYLLELFSTYLPDLPILFFWQPSKLRVSWCYIPPILTTCHSHHCSRMYHTCTILVPYLLHCTITYLNRRYIDNITIVYLFMFDFLFNLWLKHNAVYLYHHTQ